LTILSYTNLNPIFNPNSTQFHYFLYLKHFSIQNHTFYSFSGFSPGRSVRVDVGCIGLKILHKKLHRPIYFLFSNSKVTLAEQLITLKYKNAKCKIKNTKKNQTIQISTFSVFSPLTHPFIAGLFLDSYSTHLHESFGIFFFEIRHS